MNLILGNQQGKYEGSISIGNMNIKKALVPLLRRSVAFVPQDIKLFQQRTVRENIAYELDSVSDAEVTKAAQDACAHSFIEQLPQKYETILNNNGLKPSGGEEQRLLLARALLRLRHARSKILVLDEGTSKLDPQTQEEIQKAITNIPKGVTTFVIAHSLSTIEGGR